MARVAINTGASANDGTGDSLRSAGGILNNNFLELYTYLGAGSTTVLSAPLWSSTNAGINTLRNVGIGTTNPTSALTVTGNGTFTGVVTATTFIGALTGTASTATLATNAQGLTGTPNITVGVVTATTLNVGTSGTIITTTASGLVGIGTTNPRFALEVGAVGASGTTLFVNGDARVTGIVTIGPASITLNGITNIINVGTGITINGSTGIISATAIVLGGTTLTGAGVTSITAGSGISVTSSTGNVTITATGGGGSSQFVTTAAGIHTLSNVGIGTTNPTSKLTVSGDVSIVGVATITGDALINGLTVGRGAGGQISNTAIGAGSLSIAGGTNNTGIGYSTLYSNTTGDYNTAIGSNALNLNTSTSANYNTAIGAGAGKSITTGNKNTLLGSYTGNQNGLDIRTSNNNVVLSDGDGNIRFYANSSGNVGLGTTNPQGTLQVGTGITMYGSTGIISATTFVGSFSGSITDATNLTGGYANASQLNVSGVTTISQGRIQVDGSSNLRFGNLAAGSGSGRNIAIGDQVLYSLSGGQGRNIGIGELSYYDTTSGQYNIGLGIQAGQKITTGNYNVILGGYDGQTGLDIRTLSNNVVIADGQGNIRQYINSSGNVGIKTTVITEALTVAGIVSATSFYGTLNAGQLTGSLPAINGSALIGVVGSGSGVIIQENGTPVGTAGTINFGSNINVTFASGIATVSGVSSVSTATTAFNLAGSPNLNVGVVTATKLISNTSIGIGTVNPSEEFHIYGTSPDVLIEGSSPTGASQLLFKNNVGNFGFIAKVGSTYNNINYPTISPNSLSIFNIDNGNLILGTNNLERFRILGSNGNIGIGTTNATSRLTVSGDVLVSGAVTASSFSGSGSGLTNLPAGQLTGTLPAIDGSALLNVNAVGTGIAVRDDNTPVGSAATVNFGTGLDVTFSAGIATITASGGSLQSRTTVSGVTTSIANLGIGNTNITGFKSYALMKVGLSTTGWLRLYTDSTSRANDVSRSVGEDPAPGSGVIAEVVTTGISTTQIISPFVMGGNLDNSPTTTIYAAITNLSGTTQAITANLTILQLEA